jgi:formyl-CoA transferase
VSVLGGGGSVIADYGFAGGEAEEKGFTEAPCIIGLSTLRDISFRHAYGKRLSEAQEFLELFRRSGALSALQQRARTGRGCVIDTSLFETAFLWAGQKISAYVNQGRLPERHASGHPGFVPYEAFATADGPLLVCCGNDRLFAKLAVELGHPEWAADPRFTSNRQRLAHKADCLALVAGALAARPRAEWLERLVAAGVPCAPINSIPELLEEPQAQASGMLATPPGEDFRVIALPLSFDGERPQPRAGAPRLDQHRGARFDEG